MPPFFKKSIRNSTPFITLDILSERCFEQNQNDVMLNIQNVGINDLKKT